MSPGAALDAVTAGLRAEIAALDAGDLDALSRATGAKLAALGPLRDVRPGSCDPARVSEAATLNREAARRLNRARARVERRLTALRQAAGAPAIIAYGRDGRPARRVWLG